MSKEELLKAFEELSAEDQKSVRTEIADRAATACCDFDEMQKHMGAMMKMMSSSENPMDHCKQMMAMCQKMMKEKMPSATEAASSEA